MTKVNLLMSALICFFGAAAKSAVFAEIGRSVALERESDGLNYQFQTPWTARVGWGLDGHDLMIEALSFSRAESDSAGSVDVTERQALLWGREFFRLGLFN